MPQTKPVSPEAVDRSQEQFQSAAAEYASARSVSADARVLGEVEKDAPPTNRAFDKCNAGLFTPLRWGVDSLYLSFPGTLADSADKKLSELKRIAQSLQPHEQVDAQYVLGDHLFEVKDKGAGRFPYVLSTPT